LLFPIVFVDYAVLIPSFSTVHMAILKCERWGKERDGRGEDASDERDA
jgi:hypothetical protein